MDKYVYGGDSETFEGKPLSFQFYSEDVACDEIYFVNSDTASDRFFKWVASRKPKILHVVYVHNLAFDLVEFLWGHHDKLVSAGGDFEFHIRQWHVSGVYGAPTFCRITNGHNITVLIVDSFSYFRESLDKAAQRVCPDLPKLKRPAGLGSKRFTSKDQTFCAYAMRDAEVTYHLGRAIEAMHVEYAVPQCLSVAHMAATIFRHKFLSYDIPQPNRAIIDASLLSYHGGKNNITVDAGWYEGVTSLDISSAYPHAMSMMPAFSNAKLYRRFTGRRIESVPDYGIYRITGRVDPCDWPAIFSHGFKPLDGDISGVWVQGFEVNEAIRSGELHPSKVSGYYYDVERDHQAPAMRGFVEHFYDKKERAPDGVTRYMYKLIQNSISGKFIQTRKRGTCSFTDVDADVTVSASELVAGGMFHPFIASAITAQPRARIHRLEHEYKAIHTATDGIFTQRRVPAMTHARQFDMRPVSGRATLGALTVEAKDATLLLVRNKCYVLYTRRGKKTVPSRVFKGKHIHKYAMHGFQGSVSDLERMIASGRRRYTVNRPNRLKESLKRNVTPNQFIEREYTLKVGPLAVHKANRSD